MKRFLIVMLLLACLMTIRSATETKQGQAQACTCKEGEANCPCFAQAAAKKAEATTEEKVKLAKKVKKHKGKANILKIIEHKLKSSKIAPAEKAVLKKLKEDLKALRGAYNIEKMVPVDMFPHTRHLEVVTVLKKV